jgi:hypothetical protein
MNRRDRANRSMEGDQPDHSPGSVEQTSPDQHSDAKAQRYQCPDCEKSYRAKETLNRHRKNHSRHVDHVCHVCHVGFRRKDLLLRHYKIHRGDDPSSGHFKDRQRSRQACDRCSKLKTKVCILLAGLNRTYARCSVIPTLRARPVCVENTLARTIVEARSGPSGSPLT